MRGSRCTPPPPAISPTRGSGSANSAFSAAMMMSQASAVSNPPPIAQPFTAAISGLSRLKRWVMPAKPFGPVRPAASCRLHLQVVAGGERALAGAGDDAHPQVVARGELVPHGGEFVVRIGVQRVQHLGPVQRDDADPALVLHDAVAVAHPPITASLRSAADLVLVQSQPIRQHLGIVLAEQRRRP